MIVLRLVAAVNAVACGGLLFAYVDTGELVFLGAAVFCALALGCCVLELQAEELES